MVTASSPLSSASCRAASTIAVRSICGLRPIELSLLRAIVEV
jgi:hypothetical protein